MMNPIGGAATGKGDLESRDPEGEDQGRSGSTVGAGKLDRPLVRWLSSSFHDNCNKSTHPYLEMSIKADRSR